MWIILTRIAFLILLLCKGCLILAVLSFFAPFAVDKSAVTLVFRYEGWQCRGFELMCLAFPFFWGHRRAFEDDRKMTMRLKYPLQQQRGGGMDPQVSLGPPPCLS